MWARNLLFLGLVLVALVTLGANLFPAPAKPRASHFRASDFQTDDFRAVVGQVNAAFRRQWAEHDLEPAPRAPDLAVARRLSLALTGTIPSLQEIRQFESQPEGQRLPWWLAGILQDRRYADYWAERLARAYVGTEDGPFLVYRRRRFVSWLSDELLQNQRYDRLVRELLTAEGLWTDKPATNFLTVTIENANGKKHPNPERLAGRVAKAFLGIRLDCAQCHNHPFAEWKQRDFQGLAAFFGQTRQGATGIYDGQGEYEVEERDTGKHKQVEPRVPFAPAWLTATGSRRQQLAAWVTDPRNTYFAQATVNRVWALLFGRPLVEPVDDILANGDVPAALKLLADDFAGHGFDLQRLIRVVAATDAFQLDSAADHEITDAHERYGAAFPLTRLRPEQVVGAVLQAASLETVDQESHILVKLATAVGEKDFVKRYGDTGEDEFGGRGGTIPQRLLLMNGQLVKDKTKQDLFNAATRIGWLAPDDRVAVETAYLAVLTRRPTQKEAEHFQNRLSGSKGPERGGRMEDLYWTLINATEFSWNH
jgi:hypothetical protein